MKTITIDDAVNGSMLTIIYGNDKVIKEVFETNIALFTRLNGWIYTKIKEEMSAMGKDSMEVM